MSEVKVGDIIKFGRYHDTADTVAPIEWIVIKKTDFKLGVISKKLLDRRPFDSDGWESQREITWNNSPMRRWLNEVFYKEAFNDEEKEMISEVIVDPGESIYSGRYPGLESRDHIFLLSVVEATNLLTEDEWIKAEPTQYALQNGDEEDEWKDHKQFWLRSAGRDYYTTAVMGFLGPFHETDYHIFEDDNTNRFTYVRPAMWIEI